MVSGFLTSPCDQDLMVSGLAKEIWMLSNSLMPLSAGPFMMSNKSFKRFLRYIRHSVCPSIILMLGQKVSSRLTYFLFSFKSMLMPNDRISLVNTLNDSGIPGFIYCSPSTMFLYIRVRPSTSSDFTVSISCNV